MNGWQKIVHSIAGWNPDMDFIPAIPAAAIYYLSIFLIGQFLRQLVKFLAPAVIRDYLFDFVKTLTFCAYPFGHGIVRKFYGEPGYFVAMIPLVTLTIFTFPEGNGNPIGVWLNFFRKRIPLLKSLVITLVQIVAGLIAFRLGTLVFALELHPMYVTGLTNYYNGVCSSNLNVPVYAGFALELLAMTYETWFASQVFTRNVYVDTVLKVFNVAILVSLGVPLTGMFMHPAMATGLTFGCGETYRTTHILVYWLGPLFGAWISVQLQKSYSLNWYDDKKAGKQTGKKNRKEDVNRKPTGAGENGATHENGVKNRKSNKKKYY